MSTRVDLHLSAYAISNSTISSLEQLGFRRDHFANNRRCDTTVYHATYRGAVLLPDDSLWETSAQILKNDNAFVGGLEEESFVPDDIVRFTNIDVYTPTPLLVPLKSRTPLPSQHKACDIHINIDMSQTSIAALQFMESLGMASFDKPESDGIHRVYSATCTPLASGRKLFTALARILFDVPGINGQMKFETTTRILRLPSNAPALPLSVDRDMSSWINALSNNFAFPAAVHD